MSNLDFLAIPLGKYIQNNLDFAKALKQPPAVFAVNYFQKDADGKFLTDRLDKAVWVKWMELRVHGDVEAIKAPTGLDPQVRGPRRRCSAQVLKKDYTPRGLRPAVHPPHSGEPGQAGPHRADLPPGRARHPQDRPGGPGRPAPAPGGAAQGQGRLRLPAGPVALAGRRPCRQPPGCGIVRRPASPAGVAELADAQDSKSCRPYRRCGFDSRLRHPPSLRPRRTRPAGCRLAPGRGRRLSPPGLEEPPLPVI